MGQVESNQFPFVLGGEEERLSNDSIWRIVGAKSKVRITLNISS